MDCMVDFGPLQPDFNCVKPYQGKMFDLGVVFRPFGGLMRAPGSQLGDMALSDVDYAQQCCGWIVWQILSKKMIA